MGYFALSNVNHNGVEYARGEEVKDLADEQAEGLLSAGVVSKDAPAEETVVEPGVTAAETAPVEHVEAPVEGTPTEEAPVTETPLAPVETPAEEPVAPHQPTQAEIDAALASTDGSPSLNQ